MAICKELSNLGASQCGFSMKVARRLLFVPKYDDTGKANRIDLTLVKKLIEWTGWINEEVPSNRLYVLPNMENVEDVRADSEFFEWSSGQKVRIRSGVRTFTGAIPNETPALLGDLQAWEGQQFGVYIIDTDGNLIFSYKYAEETAGVWKDYAYPIYVDGNSFDAKYMKPTYTDPLHIMLQFDYAGDVNDKDLWMVPASQLDWDGRTDLRPLMSVYGETVDAKVGAAGVGMFDVRLTLDYTTPLQGAVKEDFKVLDAAGAEMPGALTVTETAPGLYHVISDDAIGAGEQLLFNKATYARWMSSAAL